ncbi:MAG: MFS transporter, partial [Solirubrobacterales bacterium]|nr:MFS transporter [Solirubrobacterales bacterium]
MVLSSGLQAAIAPLLPAYVHQFSLSDLQAGELVGVTGLAIVAIALPAGRLSDRFGARRLTLAAGALLAVGALAQAVAGSFLLVLASRLVFGLGYGALWTAGIAWLTGMGSNGSGMGLAVACSGVGAVTGPALAGLLAQHFGVAAPFSVSGVLLAALTLGLAACRTGESAAEQLPADLGLQLRLALRDPSTVAALAAVVAAGIAATVATLLVPLELQAAGRSAGEIGVSFSLAGAIFVLTSVAVTALRSRVITATVALGTVVLMVLALAPATFSTATSAVLVMLCASTATRGMLWSAAYPLGSAGAERTGAGVGVVTGFLNVVWAGTSLFTPLAAGAITSDAGPRATVAAAQALALAVA